MDDYVETTDDNGGVHINSGIPNRAFYLAATAIGGTAWEGAGADLVRRADLGRSAPTPTSRASRPRPSRRRRTSPPEAAGQRSRSAWTQVGVTAAAGSTQPGATDARPPARAVRRDPLRRVRRVRQSGELDPRRRPADPRGRVAARAGSTSRGVTAARARSPTGSSTPSTSTASRSSVGEQDLTPTCTSWPGCCSTSSGLTDRPRPSSPVSRGRGAPCAGRPGRAAGSPARRC